MECETMSSVLASVSTRKEKAAKAMASLHSHRSLITSCITDWEELERSFGITERALQQKFKELAEKEKEYDNKMQEARAALEKREESITGLEEASLTRVKEQKDTALAAIAEERKKLEEEQIKWRAEKKIATQGTTGGEARKEDIGKSTKDATADHSPLKDTQQTGEKQDLGKPTASKESKEAMRKETLTKNSSTGAHSEKKKDAKENEAGKKAGQHVKDQDTKEGQKKEGQRDEVSKNKRKDAPPVDEAAAKRQKELIVPDAKAVGESSNGAPSLEDAIKLVKLAVEASASVELKSHVDKMDWEGLRDFVVNNRKESQKLRPELQAALQTSNDPCRLLLKVLEGSEGTDRVAVNNRTGQACILLLECLSDIVADPVLGVDYPVVPSESKEIARAIARRWKSKLDVHNQDGLAVGSHLFLQLLASFGIGTDYSDDDLLNYVVAMSHRSLGPVLCRSLGLTEKIPALVDRLAKGGKQLEAIVFASAFNLLDKFNIATLLKSYLDASRKTNELDKVGLKGSGALTKQITALKNAVKVVEEHNLNSQFPLEDLRTRIAVLSQERAEKKKASTKSNQEDKPSHEHESGWPNAATNSDDEAGVRPGLDSALGKHGSYASTHERGHYSSGDLGLPIRGEYIPTDIGRPLLPPYNVDSHYRYERRPESAYDGYAMGSRSPVSLSKTYAYPSTGTFPGGPTSRLPTINSYSGISRDELLRGRPSYPEIPGPSNNYQLGSALPPPSYPPYYLRHSGLACEDNGCDAARASVLVSCFTWTFSQCGNCVRGMEREDSSLTAISGFDK